MSAVVGLREFLILSAVLFALGLYGAMSKKSAIMILMGIELMTNAINISLIASGCLQISLARHPPGIKQQPYSMNTSDRKTVIWS